MLSAGRENLPDALAGFDEINRYWDRFHNRIAAKILPGEYYVCDSNELITTVLGSCVSVCLRDCKTGVGGMNHFMLPESHDGVGWSGSVDLNCASTRYGNFAMEHMINDILKHGGQKKNLEAKIFGGGRIMEKLSDVGEKNIEFIIDYLKTEGIKVISQDVGDIFPRKVVYFPKSGRALVKRIKHLHNNTVERRERDYRKVITDQPVDSNVELF